MSKVLPTGRSGWKPRPSAAASPPTRDSAARASASDMPYFLLSIENVVSCWSFG